MIILASLAGLILLSDLPPEPSRSITSRTSTSNVDLHAWAQSDGTESSGTKAKPVSAQPKTVRTYLPACTENWPQRSSATLCQNATLMCQATPDPNDIGFWVWSAPAGATTAESWSSTGEYFCLGETEPGEPPLVVPVLTGADFQRLPLPASPIVVQPANLRTLVNVPTNLYADAETVTLPTTILGQPVQVRATPQEFRWSYGDGESLATEDAGAPYPELRTAHVYRQAGERRVALTTVYSGEYSVNGGPWLPVDGVATVASPVSTLEVVAAENRLVAEGAPTRRGE
ncbi:hypothetical protein Kisp01_01100 [Kineosporia sp. NBRC 101677]|uniref:hypothetical protein n=2 Tax=Kineosporia TaxID=49184 RepID=UPI0024A15B3E|nr:hypothetical protein [Kineosporia sp. NBRC 101677]GLY13094.1 hypothetical protein Kisp01_01100 [Kineosporia sp. NBRC 101677]